ncbi:MAG: Gfo/Idh/MocA family oxidoreductase [Pseudonocardiales bacterium]|nr:Gfo/Idh/MocA family oxidoreductase [Pseudonocardiales bacterium]
MTNVRLALVGCGAAALGCHVPAFPRIDGATLTVLVDPSPAQRAVVLETLGEYGYRPSSVQGYTDLDEALDHFDAAVVAAPHSFHRPIGQRLLDAGKHVLLEKPIATTLADAEAMRELAQRPQSPLLAMAHPRRLFPAIRWVSELIDNGSLGQVYSIHWVEGHPYTHEPVSWSMFDQRLSGGGVLIDTASHVFDVLLWWLGTDLEVLHYADDSLGGVEAEAVARMQANDVVVELELSRLRVLGTSCTVVGDKATATIGTDFPAGICSLVSKDGTILYEGDVAAVVPAQDEWEQLFVEQLKNFAAACSGKAIAYADSTDGYRVMRLIHDCYAHPARERLHRSWLEKSCS